jgi:putative flippase GtrA
VSRETALRLLKFSFVGAIGIGVQLSALAALSAIGTTYLPATALAVESAIIHNFLWHRRFTWADRMRSGVRAFLESLLRFHLSNGSISLIGNLLLMRLLVGDFGLPLIPANAATIALCFVGNFLSSDRWVFPFYSPEQSAKE